MSELSLEQEFKLKLLERQVREMSREQALHFLVELYRQMLTQENSYRNLLKHHWGMDLLSGSEEI